MQRYKRLNALNYVSAEQVANAATSEEATEMIASATKTSPYEFVEMSNIAASIGKIETAEITCKVLPNGATVNRVIINDKIECRAYGNGKNAVAEQSIKKTDFAKLKFGKCVSDGVTITDTKYNNGEVKNIAVLYCDISAL